MTHLDEFFAGYTRAMLWANAYDQTGFPVDAAYMYDGPGRWWEDTPVDLFDALAFYNNECDWLWRTGERDFSQHGHDFALTRNHHGAGFWDRGYPEDVSDHLTDASHTYGEATVDLPFVTVEGVMSAAADRGLSLFPEDITNPNEDTLEIAGLPWRQWFLDKGEEI